MDIPADFRDLLELFNAHAVEFVIVGGYALAAHGAPRFTGDLDLLVKPVPENARRVVEALDAFGFSSVGLTDDDFQGPDKVLQLGVPPVRVDILTSLTGVSWEQVSEGSLSAEFGGVPVRFIGREAFVANKRATGRRRDLADLEALGEE